MWMKAADKHDEIQEQRIMSKLMQEEADELKRVKLKVEETRDEYIRQRPKKWIYMSLCALLGLILGAGIPLGTEILNNSLFSRSGIDGLLSDYLCKNNGTECPTIS